MKSGIKTTQFLSGLVLFFAALFFTTFVAFATLTPNIIEKSVFIWILVALLLIAFLEASLYWMRQSLKIKEENMQDLREKNIVSNGASAVGVASRFWSVGNSILLILMFLVFTALAVYFIILPGIAKGLALSVQFYALIGTFAVYFVILRRFVMKFVFGVGKWERKNLSICSIEKDGILLNLPFKKGKVAGLFAIICFLSGIAAVIFVNAHSQVPLYVSTGIFVLSFFVIVFGGKKVYYPIRIKFSEIEEVRVLSFVEAQSFLTYKVGPDVSLQVQSTIDLVRFLKDPINPNNRPNTYTFITRAAGAKSMLIRGKNLFYLIALGNEDVDNLIRQIQKRI